MNEGKKCIPKRRFKEFQNDGEWEERKLDDMADVRDGTHDSPQYFSQGHPFITSKNVGGGYINYDDVQYISDEAFEEINKRSKVDKNDILMGMIGTIGNMALIREKPDFAIKNVALIKDTKKVYYLYLYHYLQSSNVISQLNSGMDGGTQKFIALNKIRNLNILIPYGKEQQAVGAFFSNLDNLITLHQRKLEKIKALKNAYLSEMFPAEGESKPKRRFAGFKDDWEQRKLTDEVELFSGLTYSPNDVVNEGGTLVLRSSNVKNGEIINADNVYVKSDVVNVDNVQEGDVIVVVRNGSRSLIGKHGQIKVKMDNTVIGAFMTGMRSSNSFFTNALLSTPVFDKEVGKNLGATINQITNGMFQNMHFMFPNEEEQIKIGDYFTQLDNLITLHQRKLDKLQNIKKAYLNEMFI
ncbi:restriction endonuclease subunit S [Anaeromicropila populeti]|uniref:Type I restriction enzyme, S subunit n=1 Tax=Anaeromicropila populeti TaxID=37658 RepID=A0A1I6JPI7_9FIRM|nr:restriction endonuclease subunit S [Anaeromicropila populeti]SFR80902.1 type I restriction enzyme, S subunit [Anaeromicropila populeti]